MTDRKLLAKVSCGIVTQWSHDGRETVCEGFPTGMSRSGPLPDRKLSAKGSCGIVTQWSFAGQETACKRFPTGMLRSSPMMDKKLSLIKKRTPMKGVLLEWQKIILQS